MVRTSSMNDPPPDGTRAASGRALWPSLAVATIGVIVTAAIVGPAATLLCSTSCTGGLLVGAIVSPTDAAAVAALLHLRRLELRARVAATLEVESGINDP